MGPTDFIRHLEQSSIAPVYLFKGDADLLMEDAWNRLLEKTVPPRARRFNGERLSAKEHSAAQVLERLRTLAMFGPKRLIMVQHIETWPKEQRSLIREYVVRPNPTACLVLTASRKKGIETIESAVNESGIVVHFATPTEREAPRWIQERAKAHGKPISHQAASLLLDQVGLDLFRLDGELEKLAVFVGDRNRIEPDDVRQAVSSQRGFSVFELLRYVSQGQANKAVFSLGKLLLSGEHPLGILALISRQIRILWQIKDGTDRGVSLAEIGSKLNLSPAVARNYAQEASRFSEQELRRIHGALGETDLALKSTGSPPEVLLEALILRLCVRKEKDL